jgi:hypothetical protein
MYAAFAVRGSCRARQISFFPLVPLGYGWKLRLTTVMLGSILCKIGNSRRRNDNSRVHIWRRPPNWVIPTMKRGYRRSGENKIFPHLIIWIHNQFVSCYLWQTKYCFCPGYSFTRVRITVQTPWSESSSELYRPNDRHFSVKLVPTSADRGCRVVSATDPYFRILDFVDQSRYSFFQAATKLYSWGWVGPVPDPLLLRTSDSAGNRIRTSAL